MRRLGRRLARGPVVFGALAVAMVAAAGAPAAPASAGPADGVATLPRSAVRLECSLPADSGRSDIAASVLPVPDGAVIVGWTSRGGGSPDGLAIRVDREGAVRWRREIGGEGADLLFSLQPDGAQGWVCAGFTVRPEAGGAQGWVLRLDGTGATTWERTYGGAEEDRLITIRAASHGWVAAGQTSRAGDVDAWVLRLDREGRKLGSWAWGGPGTQRGLGIAPLADGGCAILGRSGEGRDEVDGFVTRLGPEGREIWTRAVGGPGFQVAYGVRSRFEGTLLVTGYGFVSRARDHDAYVLEIGLEGSVRWRNHLGGRGYDRATQSVVLEDGAIVAVGYSKRADVPDHDPRWQMMLYGLDPRGRPAWSSAIGGEGLESGHGIASDGAEVWAVGQTSGPGGSRVLVVRLDPTAIKPPRH